MIYKHGLIISFLLLFFIPIYALEPRFKIQNFSVDEGMAQRRVSHILQDKNGFIWFSTWSGLSRYDGYVFENYKKSANNPNIPENNRINTIKENREGNIWCWTNDKRAYLFDVGIKNYINILEPMEKEMKQKYKVKEIFPLTKGVSWIACEQGIGFRIIDSTNVITSYSSFNNDIKGDSIYRIFEDYDGDEWILTNRGITTIGKKNIDSKIPFSMYSKQNNEIVLSTNNGILAIYRYGSKELKTLSFPYKIKTIIDVFGIKKSLYAIMTDSGFYIYNSESDSFTSYSDIKYSEDLTLYLKSEDVLWLLTQDLSITEINLKTGAIRKKPRQEDLSKTLNARRRLATYNDINNTFWLLTHDGYLAYYDSNDEKIKKILNHFEGIKFEENWFRGNFFIDNQENLWVQTINGVSKITFLKDDVEHTELDKNYETRAFKLDSDNNLWVGTKAGIIRVFDKDKKLLGYLSANGKLVQNKTTFIGAGLYCILEDNFKNIWIATKGKGLFLLKPDKNKKLSYTVSNYKHNDQDPYSLSNNDVYSIFEDSNLRIWVGCFNRGINLVRHDSDGKIEFLNYNNRLKNYPINNFNSVRYINESSDNVILIGTTGGLLTFASDFKDVENIHFYENRSNLDKENSLIGNDIMHIVCSSTNDTYVTTTDGGLSKIIDSNILSDNIAFQLMDLSENNSIPGLPQSSIEDNEHNIWFISEDAITKYNPNNKKSEIFRRNSLIYNSYYSEAIPILDHKGHLIVGTENGMMDINPYQMIKNNYIPPIAFTEINIQGISVDYSNSLKEIDIVPSQRNLSIYFATLDYTNTQEVNYAYRLLGLDSIWNYVGGNRSVSYINLPKGEYKFQVRSTNGNGIWVDNVRELNINVQPKFSETIWIWILGILVILAIGAIIVYTIFYIYRLRYKVNFEKQLTDIKLRFFTDISHELRTPLTLITSPMIEVLEQDDLSPKAREYLNVVNNNISRMGRLINQILDFRKIQNKKMKLMIENTDLISLTQKVMSNFELMKKEKQINFEIEYSKDFLFCWIDSDKYEKILFNLISNAFKFTPFGRSITININDDDTSIFVSVIDTGVGINPAQLGNLFERFESYSTYNSMQPSSGIGLSMVKELVKMHHGKIDVKSKKNEGCEFKITFQKGKEHFVGDEFVEFILDNNHFEEKKERKISNKFDDPTNTSDLFTILIVEDDKELAGFLSSILSSEYKILEASDGKEGLAEAVTEIPDFILTDIVMPEMDGLDMIKELKENNNTCHIPIIALSSKSSLEDRMKGLEYGIDDYITKPFNATYLKSRIRNIIHQRKLLQDRFIADIFDVNSSTILPSGTIIKSDTLFIQNLMQFMEDNIDNAELTIDNMAEDMQLSRSIFYRKVKAILGLSPIDFIRKTRIKRAIQLMNTNEFTISQIAYMTGFNDPKYLGKCFKKETGLTPSDFKKKSR